MVSNRRWVFAFWLYFGILISISVGAYLRFIPTKISPFPYDDTILHFLVVGMAGYLSHLALNKRKIYVFNIGLPLAPFIVLLICIFDEMIQLFVPYRSADLGDLAGNLCGIVFFTWLAEKTNY